MRAVNPSDSDKKQKTAESEAVTESLAVIRDVPIYGTKQENVASQLVSFPDYF